MPTVIGHSAVPLLMTMIGGGRVVSLRLFGASVAASIFPDADAIGFFLGIPYAHAMGHRGFSHSIAFALIVGLLGIILASRLRVRRTAAFVVLFLATFSHGLLDAMTSGGLGIAFFSPFSTERYFLPCQFIQVSPLSIERFVSERGWEVLKSEFVYIWIPLLAVGSGGLVSRIIYRRTT